MFTHKGFDITVNDVGLFSAIVDGHEVTASSMAAMKKKLDAGSQFARFDAIHPYHETIVGVVGIARSTSTWRRDEWKLGDGNRVRSVYAHTPKNRELLEKLREMKQRHEAVVAANREEESALRSELEILTPPPALSK